MTEDTGVGGGHRDIFEHLNRLRARGHEAELYSLGGPPDWFPLEAPVRTLRALTRRSPTRWRRVDAIKVATWWDTAPWVWRASVTRGIPVYFVQDIETSYYPGDATAQNRVLASYREEFRYMTISGWNRDRLARAGPVRRADPAGHRPRQLPPSRAVRSATTCCSPSAARCRSRTSRSRSTPGSGSSRGRSCGCSAWSRSWGREHGARYFERPSDERVNELFNEATVFVQTSIHEGFCLPLLEAMAAGTPVVSTDAHGNRDFCRHEENCLIADADPEAVSAARSAAILGDARLRSRLVAAGLETAAGYAWERRIDQLERFFLEVAATAPQRSAAPRG